MGVLLDTFRLYPCKATKERERKWRLGVLLAVTLTAHNFPEGSVPLFRPSTVWDSVNIENMNGGRGGGHAEWVFSQMKRLKKGRGGDDGMQP
jgi:hypothetical protein